jgi:hypothetical protein
MACLLRECRLTLLEPHGAMIEIVSKDGDASPLYIRKRAAIAPYEINAHQIYDTEVLQNRSAEQAHIFWAC